MAFGPGLLVLLAGLAGLALLLGRRPLESGFAAPVWMLSFSVLGMLAGLWLDARAGGLAALASLCGGAPPELLSLLGWHWTQLPWTHAGMLAGGLATVPLLPSSRLGWRRRLGQDLWCCGWMLLGMSLGSMALLQLANWSGGAPGTPVMLGAMLAGMVWGMVAAVLRCAGGPPTPRPLGGTTT